MLLHCHGSTYKKVMLNLVWTTPYKVIPISSATAGPLVQLGNYSPDQRKCPRDNLSTVIVAVNAHFLRHFTLTFLTMA